MNEREQIINFLLQACDQKNQIIQQLQVELAELKKQQLPKETSASQKYQK